MACSPFHDGDDEEDDEAEAAVSAAINVKPQVSSPLRELCAHNTHAEAVLGLMHD